MNIHYDIEKDGLYLEGIEKGIEKGREEGIELEKRNFVHNLWSLQEFSIEKMASMVGLDEEQLLITLLDLLQTEENTLEEALAIIEQYRLRFSDN